MDEGDAEVVDVYADERVDAANELPELRLSGADEGGAPPYPPPLPFPWTGYWYGDGKSAGSARLGGRAKARAEVQLCDVLRGVCGRPRVEAGGNRGLAVVELKEAKDEGESGLLGERMQGQRAIWEGERDPGAEVGGVHRRADPGRGGDTMHCVHGGRVCVCGR